MKEPVIALVYIACVVVSFMVIRRRGASETAIALSVIVTVLFALAPLIAVFNGSRGENAAWLFMTLPMAPLILLLCLVVLGFAFPVRRS